MVRKPTAFDEIKLAALAHGWRLVATNSRDTYHYRKGSRRVAVKLDARERVVDAWTGPSQETIPLYAPYRAAALAELRK